MRMERDLKMPDKKKRTDLSRREIRRKRRIRNQVTAYAALAVLLLAAVLGGVLGIQKFSESMKAKQEEKRLAEELAALAETAETEEEESLITDEPEEYTQDDLLQEMIDACLRDMTLEDKVAGLFLTTPEALTGTDAAVKAGSGTEEALSAYAVGGLVYGARNVQSESQFTEMLTGTMSMSKYPLFFFLREGADGLGDDLSQYGINMSLMESGGAGSYAAVPLTAGGALEGAEIQVTEISAEEGEVAADCLAAWQEGAEMLYVPEFFQEAYEGFLGEVQSGQVEEAALEQALERIYRLKYQSRLEE